MRNLIPLIILLTIFSCNSNTTQEAKHSKPLTNPCEAGRDIINIKTVFAKDTASFPTQRLYSVIDFIQGKGLFKPHADNTDKLKIKKEFGKTFTIVYDTCDHIRWIEKNFILTNINISAVEFKASRPDKYTGLTPGLHLEEWKFTNNSDRDSAMSVVETAYRSPGNITMYEKRYSQFVIDDERIFLLETGAKFAEPYAIEYKKLIERFIRINNKH